jgi:hypothetical protein
MRRLLLFALVLGSLVVLAQGPSDRESRWREDLRVFADEFSRHQLDFAKLYPDRVFKAEVNALTADAGKLSDIEITMRLIRLVASANVGHNAFRLPSNQLGFDRLPILMRWYKEPSGYSLAVVAAAPSYATAVGTRVTRIGSLTPAQLFTAVTSYIAHETEGSLRLDSTGYLSNLGVLQHLGAAGLDGRAEFTLAKPGGEPFALTLSKGDPPPNPDSPRENYSYQYLSEAKVIVVRYNKCRNDPKQPFADFTRDLFSFADSHAVERVVIDLRANSGGNSQVIEPLVKGLKTRGALRTGVSALIGPQTFSSGLLAALALQRELHATLVGEPVGEKLNGYGEVRPIDLPNSHLSMQYSTKFFHLSKDGDAVLEPTVRASATLEDALAGRDPVLDMALHHR